jgi:dihydroorotate dehydrogenase
VYKFLLKPLLFLFSPEKAHHLTMQIFNFALALPLGKSLIRRLYVLEDEKLETSFLGLSFPNPVGLAAGFDKDGKYFNQIQHLGFGFIEIGTVTPRAQDGNEQPRLFRLPNDAALINRMGFNNDGVDKLVERLKATQLGTSKQKKRVIIGANIGKNKTTPNNSAYLDYEICFEKLFDFADYFVVNVSSPNTPDLRALQEKEPLQQLLQHLQHLNAQKNKPKPILLKIAPDLNFSQLDDILEIVEKTKLAGIVATNTTLAREPLPQTSPETVAEIGNGGLSGAPLRARATQVIRYLRQHGQPDLFIMGVGGISSSADAQEKLQAGANLIQVYSGLVFEGPSLVKKINRVLLENR